MAIDLLIGIMETALHRNSSTFVETSHGLSAFLINQSIKKFLWWP